MGRFKKKDTKPILCNINLSFIVDGVPEEEIKKQVDKLATCYRKLLTLHGRSIKSNHVTFTGEPNDRYYDVKNQQRHFNKNIEAFIDQAYGWHAWDYTFT